MAAQTPLSKTLTYDIEMIGCIRSGSFPDIILRRNVGNTDLPGGEFVELKEADSHSLASFNSTLPEGEKVFADAIKKSSTCAKRLKKVDSDNPFNLPVRKVFYLVRGWNKNPKRNPRICLVHGSFFRTLPTEDLIKHSFAQILLEANDRRNLLPTDKIEELLESISFEQHDFSQVRHIPQASVNPRFRLMAEANEYGNILGSKYPEIVDNSFSLVVPHTDQQVFEVLHAVFTLSEWQTVIQKRIDHPLNGAFHIFQVSL